MAKVTYQVKGRKNPASIYVRLTSGKHVDVSTSTGYVVNPKFWSAPKRRVKNVAEVKNRNDINSDLGKLETYLIDEFNIAQGSGKQLNKNWLDVRVRSFFNRADTSSGDLFLDYVRKFIEDAPHRVIKRMNRPVKPGTIKKYNSTLRKLQEYEDKRKVQLTYQDINLAFHEDFLNFLHKDQRLNLKTTGNYIKTVLAFARNARAKGKPIGGDIESRDFFAPSSQAVDVYLNEAEIQKVYQHDFSYNERLDNVRDNFLIGLHTGLRISDFLRIQEADIKDGYIEIESTQKTGAPVIIPVHDQLQSVFEKRGGKLPRRISDQKFNEYVKDVCKIVGLTQEVEGALMNKKSKRKESGVFPKYKLISSHTCRRSFASNLYGKLPNMVIMSITGHKTEKQFLDYIKITPKEHAETLKEFWNQQALKTQGKESNLKAVR